MIALLPILVNADSVEKQPPMPGLQKFIFSYSGENVKFPANHNEEFAMSIGNDWGQLTPV